MLLLDECHAKYDDDEFWLRLKALSDIRIIGAATRAFSSNASSPVHFATIKFDQFRFSPEEAAMLYDRVAGATRQFDGMDNLRAVILEQAAGHPASIVQSISICNDHARYHAIDDESLLISFLLCSTAFAHENSFNRIWAGKLPGAQLRSYAARPVVIDCTRARGHSPSTSSRMTSAAPYASGFGAPWHFVRR